MRTSAFAGRNATNHVAAVFYHLRCVKSSFRAGKTLHDYFGIFIN
jgi:hypothetical protein